VSTRCDENGKKGSCCGPVTTCSIAYRRALRLAASARRRRLLLMSRAWWKQFKAAPEAARYLRGLRHLGRFPPDGIPASAEDAPSANRIHFAGCSSWPRRHLLLSVDALRPHVARRQPRSRLRSWGAFTIYAKFMFGPSTPRIHGLALSICVSSRRAVALPRRVGEYSGGSRAGKGGAVTSFPATRKYKRPDSRYAGIPERVENMVVAVARNR